MRMKITSNIVYITVFFKKTEEKFDAVGGEQNDGEYELVDVYLSDKVAFCKNDVAPLAYRAGKPFPGDETCKEKRDEVRAGFSEAGRKHEVEGSHEESRLDNPPQYPEVALGRLRSELSIHQEADQVCGGG